jgi:hypothetical protein
MTFIVSFYGETTYRAFWSVIFRYYPIWLPLITGIIFWELWVRYVRYIVFHQNRNGTDRNQNSSRCFQISGGYGNCLCCPFIKLVSESTAVDRYWEGQVRAWSSLEIVR